MLEKRLPGQLLRKKLLGVLGGGLLGGLWRSWVPLGASWDALWGLGEILGPLGNLRIPRPTAHAAVVDSITKTDFNKVQGSNLGTGSTKGILEPKKV